MGKKCIICSEKAKFAIKGTNDFYCEECAEEHFDDIKSLEDIKDREIRKINIIDQLAEDIEKESEKETDSE
ncbi:MAG: hypothetical protein V1740_08395 [Candidatus Woesearchaeota archaeon]